MDRPSLTGLVETCLYVTDVEKSRDFYVDLFGFEAVGGDSRFQPLMVGPGQLLILFRQGGTPDAIPVANGHIPPHDGGGPQHFAFGVPEAAFDDWKAFLAGKGIEIESTIDWPQGGRSLYFRDPDQLVVELVTPGLWPNY